MSKILIKMIIIHGGPSTNQLIYLILERLNYFLKRVLINVKSSKRATKYSIWNQKEDSNHRLRRKLVCACGYDLSEKNVSEEENRGESF